MKCFICDNTRMVMRDAQHPDACPACTSRSEADYQIHIATRAAAPVHVSSALPELKAPKGSKVVVLRRKKKTSTTLAAQPWTKQKAGKRSA